MAISAISWTILSLSFIMSIFSITFTTLLVRNFIRKKTMGTLLLALTYGNLMVHYLFDTLSFSLEAFTSYSRAAIFIQFMGIQLQIICVIWMYFFGNRHLLRDNEFWRAAYSMGFGGFVGASMALGIREIFASTISIGEGNWYAEIPIEGADFSFYFPAIEIPYGILTILFFILASVTYLRLAVRTFQLRRKARDTVTKKGLRLVIISLLSFLLAGTFQGTFIVGVGDISYLAIIVYILIITANVMALGLGYLGWTMPDWLRRRFRGEAWIAKVYTGKIPEPPSSSDNVQVNFDNSSAVEVSEK